MTTNMNTQQPDDELQHWRSSVQDYMSRNDDINLYIAAQNLNRLAPADPLGLFGLAKAQRHRGELEPAYFNITQARQRSAEPVEGMLLLEAPPAQQLNQHAVAADRYAELIALNPLEPGYVTARADALRLSGHTEEADKELRKGRDFFQYDQALHDSGVAAAVATAEKDAININQKPAYLTAEAAKNALEILRKPEPLESVRTASAHLRERYENLQTAAEYALKRHFVWREWWQMIIIGLFLLFLIPFEYGVLHGAVAGILKTPTFTEIFGTVFAVLVLLGIPLLLGIIFFFPKGYKSRGSKARKAGILLSR